MYIVIVGGGKLGSYLAGTLLRDGHQVAVIDEDEFTSATLPENMDGSCTVIFGSVRDRFARVFSAALYCACEQPKESAHF